MKFYNFLRHGFCKICGKALSARRGNIKYCAACRPAQVQKKNTAYKQRLARLKRARAVA